MGVGAVQEEVKLFPLSSVLAARVITTNICLYEAAHDGRCVGEGA